MSYGKKLNTAATAPAEFGDKVVMVRQDGTTGLTDVGTCDSMIPMIVNMPGYQNMIDQGYMDESVQPNNHLQYLAASLRYLIDKFPNGGVFVGQLNPGVIGFFIAHVYKTLVTDRLPTYSSGLAMVMGHKNIKAFGTINGEFWIKEIG